MTTIITFVTSIFYKSISKLFGKLRANTKIVPSQLQLVEYKRNFGQLSVDEKIELIYEIMSEFIFCVHG